MTMKTINALVLLPLFAFASLAVAQESDVARLDGMPVLGTAQDGVGKAAKKSKDPTYPIDPDVRTTLDRMVMALPHGPKVLFPYQVSEYVANSYGEWEYSSNGYAYVKPDMKIDTNWPASTDPSLVHPSVRDPLATTLLTFFSMSDIHLTDKESPAQCIYYGYEAGPLSNISAYSAIILYTTQVLDAAVQTINALHKTTPFDFGIALGDACNNNQYNELRWYVDVIDGKKITPSSGAHKGAKTIDYQKPYQAAGLDKSISWYQAIGNHDQFWTGCLRPDDYIKKTIVGSTILNLGDTSATYAGLSQRGFYMGVVDGTTPYGNIIDVGPIDYYEKPPKIAADSKRYSLSIRNWMGSFVKTTSNPVGHGVTKETLRGGRLCYSFHPKGDIPLKVIVLDDTDKAGSANGALDYQRYDWLVGELDAGEAAGELMIICAHIPIRPYTLNQSPENNPVQNPLVPLMPMFASYSMISEETLLQKLWSYQNLIMWVSGHVHRNAVTPQPPDASSPYVGDLTHGFWEVETPSTRDFPQEFRKFELVRNSDKTVSIFALDVDPAPTPSSPAWISRSYALAAHQIFQIPVQTGPNVDPNSGVYNAELVKQLSPSMQTKLSQISPTVNMAK